MVLPMTTDGDYERLVDTAFEGTAALDPDRMLEPWADDGVLEFPFAPQGFPARVEGKAALREFFHQFPKYYTKIEFFDRTTERLADGTGIVAQYRGEWVNIKGRAYNNRYIAIFRFRDGKLVHMREYFNPQIWVESLG